MKDFRYLPGVSTLEVDENTCVGCGECVTVCPHGVLAVAERKVRVVDADACMECGACLTNCPVGAVRVTPGTGCAGYILQSWIKGKAGASCGGDGGCC